MKQALFKGNLAFLTNSSPWLCETSWWTLFLFFLFFFQKNVLYRRCMAVDSPWCQTVLHIICCLRTSFFPKEGIFSLLVKASFWSLLHEDTRQVIMTLICWDTPVLQKNVQCVEKWNHFSNQENILFFGFSSAIRRNEDGIMSNRGWACHGEFSKFLESTHRPSH